MNELTTREQFFAEIISSPAVLIDFYALWCGPCRIISKELDNIESDFKNKVTFAKVNIDIVTDVSEVYGIRSIPTLILFRDGVEAKRIIGTKSAKDIKEIISTV